MTCAECGDKVDVDMVRDVERMRAVLERLVVDQAQTSWKADYAYRNVHSHASTFDVLLWTAVAAMVGWAIWLWLSSEGDA